MGPHTVLAVVEYEAVRCLSALTPLQLQLTLQLVTRLPELRRGSSGRGTPRQCSQNTGRFQPGAGQRIDSCGIVLPPA
jgi:hypothetical protein